VRDVAVLTTHPATAQYHSLQDGLELQLELETHPLPILIPTQTNQPSRPEVDVGEEIRDVGEVAEDVV
jgi:hypothetical protein